MAIQTSAGTTLSISASLPNSETATAYGAITFTPIGEITNVPEYGKSFAEVTALTLGNRKTRKAKGSYNNGTITVQLLRDTADAGQAVLIAALESDDNYAFEVELQDGTIQYFSGKVMSYTTNVGGTDQYIGASATIGIDTDIIEVAAP